MSFGETVFLFVLALIVFGPKKLPEIARQVGKYLAEFRRASNEFKSQIEQEIAHIELQERQKIFPPTPAPDGTASRSLKAAAVETNASASTTSADSSSKIETSSTEIAAAEASAQAVPSSSSSPSPTSSSDTLTSTSETVPSDSVSASAAQESHA